jgi:hypothetical protein
MLSLKMQRPLAALSLAACLVAATGCNKQQSAIDDAKKDAIATGQPQEVVYTDGNGVTTLTMVNPPAQGSAQPTVTSTTASTGTPTGLPDWSNGVHPGKQAVRYKAPGVVAGAAAPATPAIPVPGSAPATAANTPAPAPAFVPADITIPAGTGLAIRINQRIDVKHSVPGERFTGELAEGVTQDGRVVLPRGAHVSGVVDAAHRRGHFKGRSILSLRLTSLDVDGKRYPLETANFVASKKGKGKRTAGFIGGTAGVGMLVGGIASGGVGLLAGGLAGGGLGTLLAGTTGNRDIVIPAESLVRFRLEDDLTVQPPDTGATPTQTASAQGGN